MGEGARCVDRTEGTMVRKSIIIGKNVIGGGVMNRGDERLHFGEDV